MPGGGSTRRSRCFPPNAPVCRARNTGISRCESERELENRAQQHEQYDEGERGEGELETEAVARAVVGVEGEASLVDFDGGGFDAVVGGLDAVEHASFDRDAALQIEYCEGNLLCDLGVDRFGALELGARALEFLLRALNQQALLLSNRI